ncbi:uncharacterized protein LOC130654585 [Hydractinia symbiolongicarpus]|uniref:uncharacterized protein LOC130654585 n=1 Tax=Hydractinia symbiolongicarpus TaxID=13093 RepID=UPI00254D45C1|nr:uncharacterized protein LOC130654585 [Hydractinia symbiolongicarpus]
MDAFARDALEKFVFEHSDCDFSLVDDIIITYMASVLESLGENPTEFEPSFDVEEFTEMMAAYLPGFDRINSTLVTEWMFSLSKRLEYGIPSVSEKFPKENYESIAEKVVQNDFVLPVNDGNSTDTNNSSGQIKAVCSTQQLSSSNSSTIPNLMSVKPPLEYNLLQQMSKTTEDDLSKNDLFDLRTQFPLLEVTKHGNAYVSPVDSTELEEKERKDVPQKLSYKEKVNKLVELFDDVPEVQLRRCLSRAKGCLEKAVKMILSTRTPHTEKTFDVHEEKEEDKPNEEVDESYENGIAQLREIFPKMAESRLRDRLRTVNGNVERATQVLLSEEESRYLGYASKTRYQIHKVSSKKLGLTNEEQSKLKQDAVQKYGFIEDRPEKIHTPVVLVKEESTGKIAPLCTGKETSNVEKMTSNIKSPSTDSTETKKPHLNPKLNKKSRFR